MIGNREWHQQGVHACLLPASAAGQHIALHEPPKPNHIGLICTRTSPYEVASEAVEDARSLCSREYGASPEVHMYGDPAFAFPYVPSHLHHMVFELVKNSLRAVQDKFEDAEREPPPIRCAASRRCVDFATNGLHWRLFVALVSMLRSICLLAGCLRCPYRACIAVSSIATTQS